MRYPGEIRYKLDGIWNVSVSTSATSCFTENGGKQRLEVWERCV